MIVGIPNVGKSTLINSLVGKRVTAVGDRPGITKVQQWIKINQNVELLDTPGVLWPKFDNQVIGFHLSMIGSINDTILPIFDVASYFIDFLKILNERYPEGDTIQVILDNHSVHTSKKVKQFLSTIPGRFVFIFTPKHGSWLNMIEGFFGKMTRQMLRGIRVSSKEELVERIYKYFDEVNETPVVYHWKYRMDEF